eukprot:gene3745-4267_t
MSVQFQIPLTRNDLMSSDGENYVVKELYSNRELNSKVNECEAEFAEKGATAVLSEFDVLYSVLRHFHELPTELKEKAWMIIVNALSKHVGELVMIIDPEGMDYQQQNIHLDAVKMISYLLTQFMEMFESDATKPSIMTEDARKGKGKATKKKVISNGWSWEHERDDALCLISQLLQLDINRLWDPPIVEEEFVNMVSSVCYKFFENNAVVKLKETKEKIIFILGTLIKKYDHGLGASLKIIQLLQHFEHLVTPLVQAVESFAVDFNSRRIVADIIREISRMDSTDLSRDTSGTRSYSQFIVDLADKQPTLVLPNISLLLCHLDGDSYSMRNGVLGVIGEIIIKVLSKDDLEPNLKKTRDKLLDRLEDHIHDVHAFVRSKVLQIWLKICNEKAIPLSRWGRLMDLVNGRMQDRSSQVRRHAIQLVKVFLRNNPFAANFSIETLTKNLEKEREKLKALAPELFQDTNPEPVDKWSKIAPELGKVLLDVLDASESEDEVNCSVDIDEDASADQVIEKILTAVYKKLDSENYKEAIAMFRMAGKKWPECFQIDNDDEGDGGKDGEQTAQEDQGDKDDQGKQIIVNRYLMLFEGVFKKFELMEGAETERGVDDNSNAEEGENEEQESEESSEIKKQKLLVKYLEGSIHFATQMQESVKVLCQLLGSKTNSDILETIDFYILAHEFSLANANEGIRKMLALIWSRDAVVKEAVVNAYKKLYIETGIDNQRNLALSVVNNLTTLTIGATLGDLTSLEELLKELYKMKLIPSVVIQLLWQRFSLKVYTETDRWRVIQRVCCLMIASSVQPEQQLENPVPIPQTTPAESRAAVLLLGMFAGAENSIVKSNIDTLVSNGLGQRGKEDFLLAVNTCGVLLKLVDNAVLGGSDKEPFRFPETHEIFEKLNIILVTGLTKLNVTVWSNLAMQAVNVIYQLAEHPDKISTTLIKDLVRELLANKAIAEETQSQAEARESQDDVQATQGTQSSQPADQSSNFFYHSKVLGRVISVVGHVAFQQLVHMDVRILSELKRRHRIQEKDKENKMNKKNRTQVNQSTASVNKESKADETGLDDDMGVGGAAAEDVEAEFIRNICEKDLVTGDNLLAIFGPLLLAICSNPKKYADEELMAAACLALSKFMLVSSEFCEANLQLLFTILEKSPQPIIRSNAIISLGDLTFRFPNLIEPWTGHLYERLKDDSNQVRQTTVTVLTHLVLNDMVKVKGQISEMALCLEDDDKRIADLTRLFFTEFSQKGNSLYNVLPDIISRLSGSECNIDESNFKKIMEYLLQFIQKDKQSESLVEKICHRFRVTTTQRQWHDLAFCLSLLPYNEKSFKKLQENFACYQDMLMDENVYSCFLAIISKSKKFIKQEFKVFVEEFEQKVTNFHTKGVDDEEGMERAAKATEKANNNKNKTKRGKNKKPTKSRVSPENSDSDKETSVFETPAQKKRTIARSTAKKRRAKKPQPVFSDSDDNDDDLYNGF